jgi:hypothetical protein
VRWWWRRRAWRLAVANGERSPAVAGRGGPPNPRDARKARIRERGPGWNSLALAAAAAIVVFFAAPFAWSGRTNPCEAAELALMDWALARVGGFDGARRTLATWTTKDGTLASRGRLGQQIASVEHAGWPPFAACTALFWQARASVVVGLWRSAP